MARRLLAVVAVSAFWPGVLIGLDLDTCCSDSGHSVVVVSGVVAALVMLVLFGLPMIGLVVRHRIGGALALGCIVVITLGLEAAAWYIAASAPPASLVALFAVPVASAFCAHHAIDRWRQLTN